MAEIGRMVRRGGAALVLAAAVLALSSGSALGAAKPDLVVTALSSAPATASPGGRLQVADSVKNRGSRKAKASTTRYYLSSDRKRQAGDPMLAGHRAVRPLKPRKKSTGTAAVTVPSFAGGSYFVLACADDRRKVREAKEQNNCRASVTRVQVASAPTIAPTDPSGQGTIVNDDPVPSLSINDKSTTEGNSGTTLSTFTVSLSAPSGNTVTVNYATADGTARAGGPAATGGNDYTAATGTVSFAPGETSKTIAVTVSGDLLFEPNETFDVNLSDPQGATIADGQGRGTIMNDDAMPSLSINDVSLAEGSSTSNPSKDFVFTVSLSAPSGNEVTVNYATADGTATAPGDYFQASGTLTFQPAETTKNVTVQVGQDGFVEVNETFFVNLSNAQNAVIADGQGLGTIMNDD